MAEELNIVTPEGAETTAPSLKGSQTVKDRLKRVILHEANAKSGTTNP